MIEVERKAWLKDLAKTRENILKVASFKEKVQKDDIYFAPIMTERLNIYKDPIFRIRLEKGKQFLSYKKKSFLNKTEVNEEQETDISHINLAFLRSFFQYLRFFPFIEKRKETELYIIENHQGFFVSIEINQVEKLGDFVEIEILVSKKDEVEKADQALTEIFEKIKIPDEDVEKKYYVDLLMERNR